MKHLRIILSLSFVFLFLFGSQTMVGPGSVADVHVVGSERGKGLH